MASSFDRFWVPLMMHYAPGASGPVLDRGRMAAHLDLLRPFVTQFLIAGSTGDGWEMDDAVFADLIDFASTPAFSGTTVVVGALGRTTENVLHKAHLVERSGLASGLAGAAYAGLTVCPPIGAEIGQEQILAHYRRILAETVSPIQIYQLPQVTGCSLETGTVRKIAESGRVSMFKDTSGKDDVAGDGVAGLRLVRGAEGNYFEALRGGGYDGLLLSTGNVFAPSLRQIVQDMETGQTGRAQRLSAILSGAVAGLFAAAGEVPFGNPFANTARAVDHLYACGSAWQKRPLPLTCSGNRLPASLMQECDMLLLGLAGRGRGYLA